MSVAITAYFIAFLVELFRVVRWQHCHPWGALIPATFGFVFHTFFLFRWHVVAAQPLGGTAMLFLASAWGLILIYLLWLHRYPNVPFGIIVLPPAMVMIGSGHHWAATFETTGLSLRSLAKMLHLVSVTGFVIALSVFVICWALYFLEVRLLRKKRSLVPPIKLPSLEWSKTASRISLAIAMCCLCLSALGGIVLKTI